MWYEDLTVLYSAFLSIAMNTIRIYYGQERKAARVILDQNNRVSDRYLSRYFPGITGLCHRSSDGVLTLYEIGWNVLLLDCFLCVGFQWIMMEIISMNGILNTYIHRFFQVLEATKALRYHFIFLFSLTTSQSSFNPLVNENNQCIHSHGRYVYCAFQPKKKTTPQLFVLGTLQNQCFLSIIAFFSSSSTTKYEKVE